MRRIVILSFAVVLLAGSAASLQAFPFPYTDARALGMGGAYVANGSGAASVNYNPAALLSGGRIEIVVPNLNVRVDDHGGLVDVVDQIGNLDAGIPAEAAQIAGLLTGIDGDAVDLVGYATATLGMNFPGIGVAFGYSDLIDASVQAIVGSTNIAAPAATLFYGALEGQQVVITAAKDFGGVKIGANLRQVESTTYFNVEDLLTAPDIDLDAVTEGVEVEDDFTAIDVGILVSLTPLLEVGLVGRNVNEPEFDTFISTEQIEARYRAGAALDLAALRIVADMDLTEVESFSGTKYQEVAVGAEFKLPVLALRAGISQNSAESGDPTLLHAGVGLGFPVLKIDIGGMMGDSGDFYAAGANLTLEF